MCENGVLLSNGERAGGKTGGEIGRGGGKRGLGAWVGDEGVHGIACGQARGKCGVWVRTAAEPTIRLNLKYG